MLSAGCRAVAKFAEENRRSGGPTFGDFMGVVVERAVTFRRDRLPKIEGGPRHKTHKVAGSACVQCGLTLTPQRSRACRRARRPRRRIVRGQTDTDRLQTGALSAFTRACTYGQLTQQHSPPPLALRASRLPPESRHLPYLCSNAPQISPQGVPRMHHHCHQLHARASDLARPRRYSNPPDNRLAQSSLTPQSSVIERGVVL